ncbi:hypothetical protein ACWGI9_35325 [Streptomyces sp. NPDC054833]
MRRCVVLPKRWIVERLFGHLMRTRRLARDSERRTLVDDRAHDAPPGPAPRGQA